MTGDEDSLASGERRDHVASRDEDSLASGERRDNVASSD